MKNVVLVDKNMAHTTAITKKSKRRQNDAYYTPAIATECLLKHVEIQGLVLECCAGDGAIAKVLTSQGTYTTATDFAGGVKYDATQEYYWDNYKGNIEWVVTNPPFNRAAQILPKAYESANIGVAFLLRLSYLEPCENRGDWLASHPPSKIIIMPRISFTNDGHVDSCTTAWMVWIKNCTQQQIIIIPKSHADFTAK